MTDLLTVYRDCADADDGGVILLEIAPFCLFK